MPSVTDTISGLQDQVLDLLKTVQVPTVDAVEKVVETVEGFLPDERPTPSFIESLPNPADLVDKAFGYADLIVDGQHDFVKAIVANQRDFAKAIVGAIAPLVPSAEKKVPAKPVKATASKAA